MTEQTGGIADPPRLNIAPGQEVITLTAEGARHMRWGLIPVGRVNARGRPVMETIVNARSETVFDKSAFADVKRAVVPASGWYEWTGEKRRKQPWRITRKDGALLNFAAIYDVWNGPGGVQVHQVATVTCAPSADVRDIHHRMGVILDQSDVDIWLAGDEEVAKALMNPFPDGTLHVEKADDVDWTAG
ncbi:SOS response-associated peptidase [Loktanella sp. Alg231-35]|uniref:SOS response-associated peptidase n=1 Tax=Loktanella sp. Alg231-35 TaxID=1922220 RepID=UPI001F2C75EA|nr:SOS response-associated peptidase [Loktanella sp. Alg231-35]